MDKVKPLTINIGGKEVPLSHSAAVLDGWGKEIRRRARIRLARNNKNTTGNLSESITYEVAPEKDGDGMALSFTFPGAEYAMFVDQGVKGARSSQKAPKSPFQFGSGRGPKGRLRGAIDRWAVKKGLQGVRGADGRFISRKSMVFLITRSIYQTGIKPSYFFTTPFEEVPQQQNSKLEEGLAQDIAKVIKQGYGSNDSR